MSQIIFPINHLPPVIDIGKQTEKGVTRIGFDVHEWLDNWPGMVFSVQPVRPGEKESYLAATDMVGSVIFWLVGATDTERAGSGTVEVLGVTEDERKLSAICRTAINETTTTTTAEIPEPNQPWVDQVILAGESAKADAKAAEESAQDASQAATEAGQYSANADAQAEAAAKSAASASTFASDAEQANREASAQADDAEQSAKDAATYAQHSQAHQESALAASDDAAASAKAAKASASESAASASAAAASAVDAAESVQDVFVVKVDRNQMCSHTKQEIVGAASSGKVCLMVYYNGEVLKYKGLTKYGDETTCPYFVGSLYKNSNSDEWYAAKVIVLSDNKTVFDGSNIRVANPNVLRFKGAVEATYNGKESVVVEIPSGSLPETADPLKQLVTDESGKVGWKELLAYKYTTEGEVVNLAETALTGVEDDGSLMFPLMSPWAVDLTAGIIHTVKYNGTGYECKAVTYSELYPDGGAPEGMLALGNFSLIGIEDIEGSNSDAPFVLMTYPNAFGAEEGGIYGALMSNDGATSVTLAVSHMSTTKVIKTIDPELLSTADITFTVNDDGTVTTDFPFDKAWEMTPAELQSSIVIKAPFNNYYGNRQYTVESVGKSEGNIFGQNGIQIRAMNTIPMDVSDSGVADAMHYISWTAGGISMVGTMPLMPRIVSEGGYLKYYGGMWHTVTIDELKADLGLA